MKGLDTDGLPVQPRGGARAPVATYRATVAEPDAATKRRHVLLAPNAFKGTLTAVQACAAMGAGVRRAWPTATVTALPLADGGDGFLDTVVSAHGGRTTRHLVPGPLLVEPVRAPIGWLAEPDGQSAVIELATAAGIALIRSPNPVTAGTASTRGLGVLIQACLGRSPKKILVGIGGSASSDGGAGMARALGYRFLREDGSEIPEGGLGLLELDHIDDSLVDPRLAAVEVLVGCDVTNPLLGPLGSASTYGPQKGADAATVARLEEGLARLAAVVRRDLGKCRPEQVPGSGAGGGAGFGLVAFCGARLSPGVQLIADACDLDGRLSVADLVMTGEGRFDLQSLRGKVPGEVAHRASRLRTACFIIAGSIETEARLAAQTLGVHLLDTNTDVTVLEPGDPRELALMERRARAGLRRAAMYACSLADELISHKPDYDDGGSIELGP